MVNGQYGYGGTLNQWIAEYGMDAYINYSAADAIRWHKEVNLRLIKESNDAELMHKLTFFKNGFEALSTVIAPTQALNSFSGRGLPKTFSYKPRFNEISYHPSLNSKLDLNHNFPTSFDKHIINNGSWSQRIKDQANWFELRGTINNTEGIYQIGISKTNVIFHKNFVPIK